MQTCLYIHIYLYIYIYICVIIKHIFIYLQCIPSKTAIEASRYLIYVHILRNGSTTKKRKERKWKR